MKEDIRVKMLNAVSKATAYKKSKPHAETSEVLQYVMSHFKYTPQEKIGAIAAVSRAVKYIDENPRAKEKQVMQKIMDEIQDILDVID